jgi:cytochrome c oxidase assembly protein subunit 15
LGAVQIIGILAQGVLGGITVLTGLHPATVAAHFLLSIILIAAALSLRQRAHGKVPTDIQLNPLTRRLARVTLLLTALVIFAGTIVTGSGPHAGDAIAERFDLDPRTMSWIHADLVIALIGVTVALLIATRFAEAEETRSTWGISARNFLLVCLAQGLIGYTQYFTGLPELLVGFHILGSVLVWLSVWNLTIKGNVLTRS